MEKVIFLDIDGVLNSSFWNDSHQKEISDGTLIEKEKVSLLGELIRETGAKIVLHSGWRFWFDDKLQPMRREAEKLQQMFAEEGIRITDVTPDFSTDEIRRTKKFSLVKAQEILAWLAEHKEVTGWIVLDDLDLHNKEVEGHQIKTDSNMGLTEANIADAKSRLGAKLMLWEVLLKKMVWQQIGGIRGKRILDFGSGEGITANKFASDNEVVAIEPSEEAVSKRRRQNEYQQIIGGLDALREMESEAFDMIFCHNVLEYAAERAEIVKEFQRLLKPGGMLSVVKHNRLGRVMLETVLLNHFEIANRLLDGEDMIVSKYGTIHYYDDAEIDKWGEGLSVSKVYGIRTFWHLQQKQEIQEEAEWQDKMLQMEMRVSEQEEYRAIAAFHHLLLEKQVKG